MNDKSLGQSTIKKGLMMLNKLKGTQNLKDKNKQQKKISAINPETDLKKFQVKIVSTDELMLSNADFHVKNLLTGFLEDIDEQDKNNLGVENKLKQLRQNKIARPVPIKRIEDDLSWVKSKTKHQRVASNSKLTNYIPKENIENDKKITINPEKDNDMNFFSRYNSYGINKPFSLANIKLNSLGKKKRGKEKKKTMIMNNKNGFYSILKKKLNNTVKTSGSLNNNDSPNFSTISPSSIINLKLIDQETTKSKLLQKENDSSNSSYNVSTELLKKKTDDDKVNPQIKNENQEKGFNKHRTFTYRDKRKKRNSMSNVKKRYSLKEMEKINLFNFFQEPEVFKEDNYARGFTYSGTIIQNIDKQPKKKLKRGGSPDSIINLKGLSPESRIELKHIQDELKQNVFIQSEENKPLDSKKRYITMLDEENNNNSSKQQLLSSTRANIPEDKYRILTKKGYVYDSLDDEEVEDEIEGYFYILPNATALYVLDIIIFIGIAYSTVFIPYSLASNLNLHCRPDHSYYSSGISFIENIIDISLIVDLIINFFVGYYNFEEILISDLQEISLHYLSSWFFLDLLSAIPFNSVLSLYSVQSCENSPKYYNTGNKKFVYILTVNRLFKIFKVFTSNRFTFVIQGYLNKFNHFNLWIKFYLSLIIFFISLHCLACLFIFFGQNAYPSWIINCGLDTSSFGTIYVTSIYYILSTVTTVGYGDITSVNRFEQIFNLFLLVVGIMIYSWALTSVSSYIKAQDDKTLDYIKKCQILEDIRISHQKMPYELYDRISRYLKYRMMHEKKDKNIIIESLPIGLRNSLIYEMYKPIIKNFIFFKNFDNMDFIVRVILSFRPILAVKSDILVKEGDYIEEVIFVKTGSLNLEIPLPLLGKKQTQQNYLMTHPTATTFSRTKTKNSMLMFHLTKTMTNNNSITFGKRSNYGLEDDVRALNIEYLKILEIRKNEHFGDILMFLNQRSPLSVKVRSKVAELFFLKKTDAVEISMNYPQIWRKIIKKSLFNMEQIKRLINKAIKVCKSVKGIKVPLPNKKKQLNASTLSGKGASTIVRNQTFEYEEDSCELHSIPSSIQSSSDSSNNQNITSEETSQYEELETPSVSDQDIQHPIIHEESEEKLSKTGETSSRSPNYLKDDTRITKEEGKTYLLSNEIGVIKEHEEETELYENNSTLKANLEAKGVVELEDSESSPKYEQGLKESNRRNTDRTTPFNPSEINTELYPGELISSDICATFPSLVGMTTCQNSKAITSNLIISSSEISSDEKINTIVNDKDEEFSDFKTKKMSKDDYEEATIKLMQNKPHNFKKNNLHTPSFLSMDSQNIQITIPSEYENLNEISNYTYSKNEKKRQQVILLVKTENSPSYYSGINTDEPRSSCVINKKSTFAISPRVTQYAQCNVKSGMQIGAGVNLLNVSGIPLINPKKHIKKSKSINLSPGTVVSPLLRRKTVFESPIHFRGNIGKKPSSPGLHRKFSQAVPINLISMKNNSSNQKKPDLLNLISQNIEKNSLNLNNPELFYSEYFQKLVNQNNLKEEQNLYKRLINAEKLLMDNCKLQTQSISINGSEKDKSSNNNINNND